MVAAVTTPRARALVRSLEEQLMSFRFAAVVTLCVATTLPSTTSNAQVVRRDSVARRDSATVRTTTTSTPVGRITSERRLRVQKDMRGEASGTLDVSTSRADSTARADSIASMERARADSIAAATRTRDSIANIERMRADSIARVERARADSIAAVERVRRDSIARVDSIAAAEQMRIQQMRDRYRFNGSGWYMGIAGGGAVPTGDFEQLGYKSGFDVAVPIGWHSPRKLLGVRLDLGYSQFSGNRFIGNGPEGSVTLVNNSPKVLSAVFNLTAHMPLNGSQTVNLYGVGGAGLYHFRSFGGASALGGFLGNDVLETNESALQKTRNKLGAQVGAGIDFGVGPASVFVESRFVNVFADRDDNVQFRDFFGENRSRSVRWVPIAIGVNIR